MTLAQESLSDRQQSTTLSDDLQKLYDQTKAKVGQEDLEYIRHIHAYSKAIKTRSEELLQKGGTKGAFRKGAILKGLHILLEFSELGHLLMHGPLDNVPSVGEYHSDKFKWEFVTDAVDWKIMHHQNHHPDTSIVGKDHDLGYSFLRFYPDQKWFGHNAIQVAAMGLLLFPSYFPALYTLSSALRVEGRDLFKYSSYKRTFDLIGKDVYKNFVKEPLSAGSRFFQTFFGNFFGTTLGYDLTMLVLAFEHHAPNVELFTDPGPTEGLDEYYRRQILGTTNFIPWKELDDYFQSVIDEEVDFDNKPPFRVFYGGLETHLEHHLFPDLPGMRLREIAGDVERICEKHGLPYNNMPYEEILPEFFKSWVKWSVPANGDEKNKPLSIFKRPTELLKRVFNGMQYKVKEETYFKGIRYFNATAKVVRAKHHINNQAISLSMEKPKGWESIKWEAGAYISVRFNVNGEDLVRQYSLVNDSHESDTIDITIKRVKDGRVSNFINDKIKRGSKITLVGPPQNDGAFVMKKGVKNPVFLAGGVGITPIISMIREMARERPKMLGTLLYFNRDENSILYEEELRSIEKSSNLTIHFICDELVEDKEGYEQNVLSKKLLKNKIKKIANADAYVCAPEGFIKASKSFLLELGLKEKNFHMESFTPLKKVRPNDSKEYTIRFANSDKEIKLSSAYTLLEAARKVGLNPPAACEQGLCKACVCSKTEGKIKGEKKSAPLSRITICNSFPKSDVVLEL